MVGVTGIEPVTPTMSTQCSPLSYTPYTFFQTSQFLAPNTIYHDALYLHHAGLLIKLFSFGHRKTR